MICTCKNCGAEFIGEFGEENSYCMDCDPEGD